MVKSSDDSQPKRMTRSEARAALPEELRGTFDEICDETIAWSQYFYGTTMVSYSILMKMIEDGWTKNRK
jgi:hypothetical protein